MSLQVKSTHTLDQLPDLPLCVTKASNSHVTRSVSDGETGNISVELCVAPVSQNFLLPQFLFRNRYLYPEELL